MQFTILADKLPEHSIDQFIHEFRVVHARETKAMAQSLGIVSEYVQGILLPFAGQKEIDNLPIHGPGVPLKSFAQLTWPALEVLQGSFTTQGYKSSAGKHIFAVPRKIFLTERLEPPVENFRKRNAVRVVVILLPTESSEGNFRTYWDKHADLCRSTCSNYQRNQVLNIGTDKVAKIFIDTAFPASAVVGEGGFEEFVFQSNAEAQAFFTQYGEELRLSYDGFTSDASFCVGFDTVVHYDDGDKGYQQIITGIAVSLLLRIKVYLGI
jgi:hypothetical protein